MKDTRDSSHDSSAVYGSRVYQQKAVIHRKSIDFALNSLSSSVKREKSGSVVRCGAVPTDIMRHGVAPSAIRNKGAFVRRGRIT